MKLRAKRQHTEIGGVDANGTPHDPLVFDDDGLLEVDDDQQEFAQTIAHALEAGTITQARESKG